MNEKKKEHVGGQAVIEGVMMRSPKYVTVAVRKPDGTIVLKKDPYTSFTKKHKFFSIPFIRGGIVLIESLVLGIKALNFSGDIAMKEAEDEASKKDSAADAKKRKKASRGFSGLRMAFTIAMGLGLGILLFFYIPMLLTDLTGIKNGILFNIIDGCIRLTFFMIYLILISQWKEIRRIFEYHGAEHKTIFAYEDEIPLHLEDVKKYTTHHPRCGTSFLFVVMFVAVVVFIFLGRPEDLGDRFLRLLFVPVVGGISYEIIRLSDTKYGDRIARILTGPGMLLQRITTREPDEKQLETAIVALRSALDRKLERDVEIFTSTP